MPPRCVMTAVLAILLASSCIGLPLPPEKVDINKVDINHSTLAELEQIPGLTPAWAQRIIRFRPYRTKLDLVQEGILPAKIYSKIRDSIIAHQKQQ